MTATREYATKEPLRSEIDAFDGPMLLDSAVHGAPVAIEPLPSLMRRLRIMPTSVISRSPKRAGGGLAALSV